MKFPTQRGPPCLNNEDQICKRDALSTLEPHSIPHSLFLSTFCTLNTYLCLSSSALWRALMASCYLYGNTFWHIPRGMETLTPTLLRLKDEMLKMEDNRRPRTDFWWRKHECFSNKVWTRYICCCFSLICPFLFVGLFSFLMRHEYFFPCYEFLRVSSCVFHFEKWLNVFRFLPQFVFSKSWSSPRFGQRITISGWCHLSFRHSSKSWKVLINVCHCFMRDDNTNKQQCSCQWCHLYQCLPDWSKSHQTSLLIRAMQMRPH